MEEIEEIAMFRSGDPMAPNHIIERVVKIGDRYRWTGYGGSNTEHARKHRRLGMVEAVHLMWWTRAEVEAWAERRGVDL